MKLLLDSGHNAINPDTGWIDPGACFGNYEEAKIAESIKLKIAKNLDNKIPYRVPTYFWNTDQRYQEGKTYGCDYYLVLHCNAGGASGACAMYNKHPKSESLSNKLLSMYSQSLGLKALYTEEKAAIMAMERTDIPIILLELGFIDNSKDRNILVNQQQYIADAITEWLLFVAGIKETVFIKDSNIVVDNFAQKTLSSPVKEINSRTYIPLRDFCELTGKKIGYKPNTKEVFIY